MSERPEGCAQADYALQRTQEEAADTDSMQIYGANLSDVSVTQTDKTLTRYEHGSAR